MKTEKEIEEEIENIKAEANRLNWIKECDNVRILLKKIEALAWVLN